MNLVDYLIGKLAYVLWDTKEGGQRLSNYKSLQKIQYLSSAQLRAHQIQRLTSLIKHAHHSSAWYRPLLERSRLHIKDQVTPEDLTLLPITTKADIREHTADFISNAYEVANLRTAKTGGSTGVSLNLYFDEHCQQLRNAAQMYADNLAGWKIGTRVAAIWGNPPVPKTFKQKLRAYLLDRTLYLDTMDLNPTSMNTFLEQWRSFGPQVIFGHSHSIFILAQFVIQQGISDVRPKGIVATSMMLLDHEREVIEQAFACKVTNRYGCEEVGLIGVECEKHQGMHINTPHLIVECLDDNNQPVAPGQPGKLVITDLNNFGMPLIRYRVEDVGVLASSPCACGRTTPILERLEGRIADFLKKPDGGMVAGVSLVERTLTKIPGIEQMQLIQERLDELVINRVKANEYSADTDKQLLQEFREVFDERVTIIIRDVDKIPQEKSGKYRFSICRI